MKKILLAVDHSIYSLKAASIAISLARSANASVSILHVIDTRCYNRGRAFVSPDTVSSMKDNAIKLITKIKDIFFCPDAQMYVDEGSPHQRIRRMARILESDIIVIGLHGSSAFPKEIGSVANNVLRRSDVPVLIVPFKSVDKP